MNLVTCAEALLVGQIVGGGAVVLAFRRAWSAALAEPADTSCAVEASSTTADGAAGWYRPATDQIFIAARLRHRRSLAELAVIVHEGGHRRQQATRPWTIQLQVPFRALAFLTGSVGSFFLVLGFLLAKPDLRDLGMIVASLNLFGSLGLVALEWDASQLGLAALAPSRDRPDPLKLLLRLAGLTYLLLPLTLVEPLLAPEPAPSLPLADEETADERSTRKSAAGRSSHGERGTENSADQSGST